MAGCMKIVLSLAILAHSSEGHPRIMLNSLRVRHQLKDFMKAPSDVEHKDIHQLAAGMKEELRATQVMVGRLRKQTTEARQVHSLLQAATRMAHHGAVAGAVQERLSARFALVLDDFRNKFHEASHTIGPAAAAAEERHALRAFASGMERVAGVDGRILAVTKRAASQLGRANRDNATMHISSEDKQLLSKALRREARIVSEELKNAKWARMEASRLEGILQAASGAPSEEETNKRVVADVVSEDTGHILSEMSKAKERIGGLLRGSKEAALARRVSKAIDGAERAEANIASMESHQLVQAREGIQKLQQLAAGTHKHKHAKFPANAVMHPSRRAKLQPMAPRVHEVITQQVLLAERESRLATRSSSLAAELQQRAEALAEGLHNSGDSTDHEVAAEIEKQLAIAQSMLKQMAFIHKKLGQEAVRKVVTLRRQERKLAQAARQHR